MFFIEKKGKLYFSSSSSDCIKDEQKIERNGKEDWFKIEPFSLEEGTYLGDLKLSSGFLILSDMVSVRIFYERTSSYRTLWTNHKFLNEDTCKFALPVLKENETFHVEILLRRGFQYKNDPCEIDFHLYIRNFACI